MKATQDLVQNALERRVDVLAAWLAIWTAFVAIGLLMEYGAEAAKWRKLSDRRDFRWVPIWIFLGGMLVAGGVGGELTVEFLAARAENALRTFSDTANAILIDKAAQAEARADEANSLAAKNQKESSALAKRAEDERLARVKIQEQISWRALNVEQSNGIRNALAPFPGFTLTIDSVNGDAESAQYAAQIADTVRQSGWKIDGPNVDLFTGPLPQGVFIFVPQSNNPAAAALQHALKSSGVETEGHVMPGMKPGTIELLIGIKSRGKEIP